MPLQALRLLIVGFGGVGKSTLMRALCASDAEMAVFHNTVGKGWYRDTYIYTHTCKSKGL
jgi:GTPase SAR1 family protein